MERGMAMTENNELCLKCLRTGLLLEMAADDDYLVDVSRNEDTGLIDFDFQCGDTFGYACADGETIPYEEAEAVHAAYKAHGRYGLVAWAAKKRGMKPVVEICESMEKTGVPLLDGLKDNPANAGGKRW